jgi:hypothetical protein
VIKCANCGYEVDEVDDKTKFCQTCQKAYDRGWTDGVNDGACYGCGVYTANEQTIAGETNMWCDKCYEEMINDLEGENK